MAPPEQDLESEYSYESYSVTPKMLSVPAEKSQESVGTATVKLLQILSDNNFESLMPLAFKHKWSAEWLLSLSQAQLRYVDSMQDPSEKQFSKMLFVILAGEQGMITEKIGCRPKARGL